MHGFAAQVFADAGAQHCAAIATTGVGRSACAFELDFLRAAMRGCFTQPYRTAIAQLPGPLPKLVPAVDRGHRVSPRQGAVARESAKVFLAQQVW